MKVRKIGIIGAGHVGSHVGFALATQGEVDELVLIDCDQEKARAQALDIEDAVSYLPHHVKASAGEYQELVDADCVVICVGPPSGPSEDRLDELEELVGVLDDVLPKLQESGFKGFIINISNPADVITTYIQEYLDYPQERIFSTGCVLDSARLQSQLANMLKINRQSLNAFCLGEHGFSAMIPWSHVTISGQPLVSYLAAQDLGPLNYEQLLQETKDGGYQVLLGKGATEFGIATALVEVIKSLFHDERKILPVSVYLDGQYGQEGIFASVPAIIGKRGVEGLLEWQLSEGEQADFERSCAIIRTNFAKIHTF
ncbi:L-lactate dehydrogenase [Vagococcus sp. BWB3-3]|uniref:L-lactate dehydrogenase n=1 Tax=Vagococcus allomyrinae TaxID=2794353 RepID=A0A940PEA2_9ENTE|nr:L-lactate dehydrogenase [Vagococcus allomyrinae]MBP1043299.1 L-lactate dehydrogenase [Vagococcus allomyrinae]